VQVRIYNFVKILLDFVGLFVFVDVSMFAILVVFSLTAHAHHAASIPLPN
jgi:hypothetical protein